MMDEKPEHEGTVTLVYVQKINTDFVEVEHRTGMNMKQIITGKLTYAGLKGISTSMMWFSCIRKNKVVSGISLYKA